MADALTPLCSTADIPENSVKSVESGGRMLAVYNIGGAFYVTDEQCTHAAASLADGLLDGDVIECSMHFGAFHVPTGKPVAEPCSVPLRTYRTAVRDGQVLVDLEKAAGE